MLNIPLRAECQRFLKYKDKSMQYRHKALNKLNIHDNCRIAIQYRIHLILQGEQILYKFIIKYYNIFWYIKIFSLTYSREILVRGNYLTIGSLSKFRGDVSDGAVSE